MKTREQQLECALREVMTWIDNWSPEFTYDAEWPITRNLVEVVLEDRPLYIGLAQT